MQNIDVAHRFFYDPTGSFDRNSMNVSYYQGRFYSYGTVVAQLVENKQGLTVCLISDNSFSATTAKHINDLRGACPFMVYYFPQRMYNRQFNASDIVDICIKEVTYYSNQKLTQKANRDNLTNYYVMLKSALNLPMFNDYIEKITQALNDYKDLYNLINDPEKLKIMKEKQRKKDKEERQKLNQELTQILGKYSYLDLIHFAYADMGIDKEIKIKLKKYLNPKNDLSFIWFDGGDCITSKNITVSRKEVEALLKLWQNDKLKRGMTISHYTVLDVKPEYVKVGCHIIPTKNLTALYNSIQEKIAA